MKAKQKKNKPSHSMFSNAVWSVGMLAKTSPVAFIIIALMIPVHIGMRYLGIYLPALVVSEVTTGQTLYHALFAVGMVMLAILFGNLFQQALGHVQSSKLGVYRYKLTNLVTRKNMSLLFQTYERKDVRDLAGRATYATQMWNGSQPLTDIVRNGFGMAENLLGYLLFGTLISFASPWLVPILTVAPVVNFLSVRAYNKWEYANRQKMWDTNQKLGYVEELPDDFSAAKDIRIYGLSTWLRACYKDLSAARADWDKKTVRRSFASRISDLVVILLRDGGAYALLIYMWAQGEITPDQFVLYFAAISSFADWVGGIIGCWNQMHSNSLQICDFRDYVDYPDEETGSGETMEGYLSSAPEIVFDHVSFRYDSAEEDTIQDLSFTLHRGEKLALVGLNGAGKTTVVKLLCGLYTPTSGEIRLNGIPLSKIRREDYYKLISPVFQDTRTAFFSLAETVSCTREAETDLQRAEACMRTAGLGEKLDSLPEGIFTKLNKRVNKNGTELSGGEVQKLMLARALYKDAPLLVLDEPTAALDPIAESHIYETYNRMCQNKTSLFISHRLASTAFCDRILLLESGRVAEEGTHTALLRQGGGYKELFDLQSCWYKEDKEGDAV